MKKKLSLLAAFLACVFAFAACSARVTVTLSRNWNTNPQADYDANFYEQLTYDVRYEAPETSSLNGLTYADVSGTYTVVTEAQASHHTESSGTSSAVYHLRAVQEMHGSIVDGEGNTVCTFGGDSGVPADTVEQEVWFRDIGDGLAPIESRETYFMHVPLQSGVVGVYSYTASTLYNADASRADVTVTDKSDSVTGIETDDRVAVLATASESKSYSSLTKNYSVFDNAQLAFMGRGMTFTAGGSNTVTVVSASGGAANVVLSCEEIISSSYHFTMNGDPIEETDIPACTVNFSITGAGQNTGVTHTVYYANRAASGANTYRNLPLRRESPFAYGMGTLLYVLTDARYTRPEA